VHVRTTQETRWLPCKNKTLTKQNGCQRNEKTSKAKPTSLPGINAVMSGSNDQVK